MVKSTIAMNGTGNHAVCFNSVDESLKDFAVTCRAKAKANGMTIIHKKALNNGANCKRDESSLLKNKYIYNGSNNN
ncbi:hypothetical protein KZO01_09780 [Kurthia zopfii]|nr:hypothetical protein KZO01_09780 [Kurthia zopfii]